MNTFFSLQFGVIALVIFILSLFFRHWFLRRLVSQVGNDELLPSVKELLSGKTTRKEMIGVRDKLLSEGIEPKRVGKLIAMASSSKARKFPVWLVVLLILMMVIDIIRGYNSTSNSFVIITPVGPTIYRNLEKGYEISLPQNWVGIKRSESPDSMYFAEKGSTANPIGIKIESIIQKDIASSTVQQKILQLSYERLAMENPNGGIYKDFISQPPYIEYTGITAASLKFHSRWEYFFGNGRAYALQILSPDDIWAITMSESAEVISTFKINGN